MMVEKKREPLINEQDFYPVITPCGDVDYWFIFFYE